MMVRSIAILALAAMTAAGCARAPAVGSTAIVGEPRSLTVRAQPTLSARLDVEADEAMSRAETAALDFAGPDRPTAFRVRRVTGDVSASTPFRVSGRTCRRFVTRLSGPDLPAEVEGTACRQGQVWSVIE